MRIYEKNVQNLYFTGFIRKKITSATEPPYLPLASDSIGWLWFGQHLDYIRIVEPTNQSSFVALSVQCALVAVGLTVAWSDEWSPADDDVGAAGPVVGHRHRCCIARPANVTWAFRTVTFGIAAVAEPFGIVAVAGPAVVVAANAFAVEWNRPEFRWTHFPRSPVCLRRLDCFGLAAIAAWLAGRWIRELIMVGAHGQRRDQRDARFDRGSVDGWSALEWHPVWSIAVAGLRVVHLSR